MKIDHLKILELARSYSEQNIPWHHHFLTTHCTFNGTEKFKIILENERTSESFEWEFEERPMKLLEELENIFFKR